MVVFAVIFYTVVLSIMVLAIICGVRNEMVSRYRGRLIQDIHNSCAVDINLRRDWQWRYEAYDKVSYNSMVLQFWRPLDSFYPDQSFRHPDGR